MIFEQSFHDHDNIFQGILGELKNIFTNFFKKSKIMLFDKIESLTIKQYANIVRRNRKKTFQIFG